MEKTRVTSTLIIAITLTMTLFANTTSADIKSNNQIIQSYGEIKAQHTFYTEGQWIKDGEGNVVILRGVNFEGLEYGAWNTHTEQDYAIISSWGLNVVRLPIAWSYIESEPGTYNYEYLNYVDRDIAWAKQNGLYVILDMHQYQWSPYFDSGNGMPIWAVSNYPRNNEGKLNAIDDFWLGKGPNGTQVNTENPSVRDRYINMWMFIANYYLNEPTIIAYDLFNEPNSNLSPDSWQVNYLYPFYKELINAIRSVDANRILIYEPFGRFSVVNAQLAKDLTESNLVASFHFYDNQPYNANFTALEKSFISDNPLTKVHYNWTIPVLVGEFGVKADTENAQLWLKDSLSIFEKYQVGWMYYTYQKSDKATMVLMYADGTERAELTAPLKR